MLATLGMVSRAVPEHAIPEKGYAMAKQVFKITTDANAIGKYIASIGTRSAALKADIHITAISAGLHMLLTGDATLCSKLNEAMGEGWHRNALKAWFEVYYPVRWAGEDQIVDGKAKSVKQFKKDHVRFDMFKAEYDEDETAFIKARRDDPFWEFKPEPEFQPISVMGLIQAAIKRVETQAKKHADMVGKEGGIDTTGLDRLKALANDLKKTGPSFGSNDNEMEGEDTEV